MSDEHSHIEASPLLQNQNHGNSTSPSHKDSEESHQDIILSNSASDSKSVRIAPLAGEQVRKSLKLSTGFGSKWTSGPNRSLIIHRVK